MSFAFLTLENPPAPTVSPACHLFRWPPLSYTNGAKAKRENVMAPVRGASMPPPIGFVAAARFASERGTCSATSEARYVFASGYRG